MKNLLLIINILEKLSNISDNGVALSLNENFEGFIQPQDLSWLKKPPHPSKLFQNDQLVEVTLLEIRS